MVDFTEAIAALRRKRENLIEQVTKVDVAIQAIQDVAAAETTSVPTTTVTNGAAGATGPVEHRPSRVRRGVQPRVESLLREYDRDWSVQEIIEAFERRGDPLTSAAPKNAVRTALVNLHKGNKANRTSPGRYRSVEFREDDRPRRLRTAPRGDRALGDPLKGEAVEG